jgi:phosphomannomutase
MSAAAAAPPAARSSNKPERIFLFDVDGTLTVPRLEIEDDMRRFMADLRTKSVVGIVGGSDLSKQLEQLGKDVKTDYDYLFSENGLVSFKAGAPLASQSMAAWLGQEKLNKLLNFILKYVADLDIPIKRGTFVEFRTGMLNVSPIGRNCSHPERIEFEKYDKIHNIRTTMVAALQKEFGEFGLKYSIGGQISFDVFPIGWDKTYCLSYLKSDNFKEIHFFGDKTYEGGNDYEIFSSSEVIGHTVTSPADTRKQVQAILDAD